MRHDSVARVGSFTNGIVKVLMGSAEVLLVCAIFLVAILIMFSVWIISFPRAAASWFSNRILRLPRLTPLPGRDEIAQNLTPRKARFQAIGIMVIAVAVLSAASFRLASSLDLRGALLWVSIGVLLASALLTGLSVSLSVLAALKIGVRFESTALRRKSYLLALVVGLVGVFALMTFLAMAGAG